MLFNSYSYKILYEQFHWIYLQGDIKLLLVTINNRLKFEIEIVNNLSCHPIIKTTEVCRVMWLWQSVTCWLCTVYVRRVSLKTSHQTHMQRVSVTVFMCLYVCVYQPAGRRPERTRHIARQFLLMWSCFGTRVIRDMTLQSAPSFGQ